MSKKSRRELKANLYENDIEELIYSTEAPVKTTHIEATKSPKIKITASAKTKDSNTKNSTFSNIISEKIVACKCNKCNGQVNGNLVSYIYTPVSDLNTPFVSYECKHCGHSGFRSVKEKALKTFDFDKVYF